MKIRCTAQEKNPVFPNPLNPSLGWACDVTPGQIYLVLALTISTRMMFHGQGVTVEIIADDERWALAPLRLFEVVDPRPSRYWSAKQIDDGAGLVLSPPSFQAEFWADDLTDGNPEIVADFEAVVTKLRREFSDG